jgi:hypothetical protein
MGNHKWRFFRTGGFDQVSIESGADLVNVRDLDQKLWVALSCPVKEVDFDTRTLELIDSDHDGHIRPPEMIEAISWAASLLKSPDTLVERKDGLPISAINDATEEGRQLFSSARQILTNLGKKDVEVITVEDTLSEERIFAQTQFNGDGIITADSAEDQAVGLVITDIIECLGAETDRSGNPGVSEAKADQFFAEAQAYSDWQEKAEKDTTVWPLEEATGEAFDALNAIRAKADDFFTRCKLASFDTRSAPLLNPSGPEYEKLSPMDLSGSSESFAGFPLALIEPDRPLPLRTGINPAWTDAVGRFHDIVVVPLLGEKNTLSYQEWQDVKAQFASYEAWLSEKPVVSVEKLGLARVREVLGGTYKTVLGELLARDKAFEPEAQAISSVDKLVHYCRDLHRLSNNFIAFRDFYNKREKAIFQAGTLYLDGRSCDLCVRASDVGKHATLANLSRLYLVYCDCVRRGGDEKMTIAAAFTAGDSDQLMVGRNGVFYDRKGQDWDATIVRIIEHPISVRQAFWTPYKKVSKMIGEQMMKFAATRQKSADERMAVAAVQAGQKAEAGKPPAAQPFDVGRSAGIFAAIGLALGAIGTAVASILTGLLGLSWWQIPLVVVGLLLLISGPSMLIAWLKLRQRNLAPLLDANGWAVNTRAKINIPFGTSLTSMARLPEGAERSVKDPYAEKKKPWGLYLLLILFAVLLWVLWRQGILARLLGG